MMKFSGKQYLMIDIANNFGLDKINWDARLDWVLRRVDKLEDFLKQADEPALFFAGVQAFRKAQAGEPSGYPISLDACSSGLQILSCLAGDRNAAKLCGVVSTGDRENAYNTIFEEMQRRSGSETIIDPDKVKKAVMTLH